MAELLVKAIDHTHPDPEIDAAGAYKKGDIVVVREDGHTWGAGEGPPAFVLVKVPGVSQASVENRIESWQQVIAYEVVATDPALDGARIRLYTENPGAANEHGITHAKIEGWIEKWGGALVSQATNEVRFDITVQNVYKSEAFWGADPATLGVVITETNYDQGTGVHTATIDVSGAANVTPQTAESRATEAGGTVTGTVGDVVTVEFERVTIRTHFLNAMREALRKTVRRRRYYFAAADVDTALGLGGVVTLTPAQATAKAIDKAA